MFITIPLLVAVLSLVGIAVIVQRKMPYVRRLNPEAHPAGESVWHDFFPELIDGVRSIHIAEYKKAVLIELEKLLRRVRIVFSAIDRMSDSLIKAVRQEHLDTAMDHEQAPERLLAQTRPEEPTPKPEPKLKKRSGSSEELKLREQELIIAIAQDPKDVQRYQELARVYVDLENFADARESLEAALKLEPENREVKEQLESLRAAIPGSA